MTFHRKITPDMVQSVKIQNFVWPEELERIPKEQWPPSVYTMKQRPKEAWRSRHFLVQVYKECDGIERLSVCRTEINTSIQRFVDGITWDELQEIKRQCGRGDRLAVEIYPKDIDIVNVGNLRHLWILNEKLPFGWGKS